MGQAGQLAGAYHPRPPTSRRALPSLTQRFSRAFFPWSTLPLRTGQDTTDRCIFPNETGECKFDPKLLKSLSSDVDLARYQFWTKYEETASKFDMQFVSKLENDIDISMLFAGLFSAVNTAFIVAIQSNIVVVNSSSAAIANVASAGGLASSPAWTTVLSYASLSASLLAAFGTLLAKQWLAQFNLKATVTRLTDGSLSSRGLHRQRKFDVLQTWHFNAILDSFPVLLQASLLLFAISLLGATWNSYHDVAGVVLAATTIGITLYSVTFFAAMLSSDSPFQTPLSRLPRLLLNYGIQLVQLPRRLSLSVSPQDSESLPLSLSTLSEEAPAVRWLLRVSTDPAVVTAVASMVPEVDWSVDFDFSGVARVLWVTFKNCFSVQDNSYNAVSLYCSDTDRAYACGKALFHLYSEALYGELGPNTILQDILAEVQLCLSSTTGLDGPQKCSFTFICGLISWIIRDANTGSSMTVPEGELSWVSHVIPAFLHNTNHGRRAWMDLAASIIPKFTRYETMPSRVLADHWVIIALIIGIPVDPNDLVKIDKSQATARLREEVCAFIEPGSPRRGTVVKKTPHTPDFALALDLALRVLSIERDRGMIAGRDLDGWVIGLYERLITGEEDHIWEQDGRTILSVMFRTVRLHSLVEGERLRRSGEYIKRVLKDSVESSDGETVGHVLPLWLDSSQQTVDCDLCLDAIALLLGCDNPRLCHVAFHSIPQALDASSRHSLHDLLQSDESKLTRLLDTFDSLRTVYTIPVSSLAEWDRALKMNAEDKLNAALGYLRVVAAMADNAFLHGPLLARGYMQKCIDIRLDTWDLAASDAETLHREHSFLLLSIVASVGTCSNPSCVEAAMHPSATIVEDYPLEWQTIVSAMQHVQHAHRHQLDANRIAHIADYLEMLCRLSHDVPMALREFVEPIAARIQQTDPSALDSALTRLLHVLGTVDVVSAAPTPDVSPSHA